MRGTTAKAQASSWKETKASLQGLGADRQLRAAVGQQDIVLGTRSGAARRYEDYYVVERPGWVASAPAPVKVEWQEHVVLDANGPALRRYERVTKIEETYLEAGRKHMDEQIGKPIFEVTFPKIPEIYGAPGS